MGRTTTLRHTDNNMEDGAESNAYQRRYNRSRRLQRHRTGPRPSCQPNGQAPHYYGTATPHGPCGSTGRNHDHAGTHRPNGTENRRTQRMGHASANYGINREIRRRSVSRSGHAHATGKAHERHRRHMEPHHSNASQDGRGESNEIATRLRLYRRIGHPSIAARDPQVTATATKASDANQPVPAPTQATEAGKTYRQRRSHNAYNKHRHGSRHV